MQVLLYAYHICYIDANRKLEVGAGKNRAEKSCHNITQACQYVIGAGMESDRGYYRCKLRHNDSVTGVVLSHRRKVVRNIFKLFLKIISKEVVNRRSSVGIVIVHHISLHRGDIR